MKKIFLSPFAVVVTFFCLFIHSGCKKDVIQLPVGDIETASIRVNNLQGFILSEATANSGSISGIVIPLEAKPKIFLYSTTTSELSLDNNGAFYKNIPPGVYSIDIFPENLEYMGYYTGEFVVSSGVTTNLGTLMLDYVGDIGGIGCEIGWGRIGYR